MILMVTGILGFRVVTQVILYTPRKTNGWIPKLMAWKMYLRLQTWLFFLVAMLDFRGDNPVQNPLTSYHF